MVPPLSSMYPVCFSKGKPIYWFSTKSVDFVNDQKGKLEKIKKVRLGVIIAGAAVGLAALILTALGNPTNMGFCIACFLRDISGAVGLHSAAKVQYVRPEIIGLVLSAFIMSVASKEFKARAGSPPALPKSRVIKWSMPPKARTSGGSSTSKRRSDYHIMMKRDACRASLFILSAASSARASRACSAR